MPVSVSIEPFSPSLDMYDSPDTSTAYSLSGHIAIKLTPSASLLGLSRPSSQNLLLTSLELTFEGQTELLLNEVGYAPFRLISLTKQLVSPSEPVQISADEDRAEWRIVFDLPVPGWLPATSLFGDDDERVGGISYALFARARFHSAGADLDDVVSTIPSMSTSSTSVWNNLCSVVRLGPGRPRAVHAEKVPIQLIRYVSPHTRSYDVEDASEPAFSPAVYAIQAIPSLAPGEEPSTNIPADILRDVQLHAIVSSRTSVKDDSIPLVLRLRSRSEDTDTCNRLKVLGFEVDVMQIEKYHTSPSSSYTSRYPIPPPEQQPPLKPLKSTHPIGTLFELGLFGCPPTGKQVVRERTLAPKGASGIFRVRGSESNEEGVRFDQGWLRMEVGVPVSPGLQERSGDDKGKRVAGDSPFLHVKHEMRIKMTVGYDQPDSEDVLSDELAFVVPLDFVRLAPPVVSPLASTFFHSSAHSHSVSTSSLPLPHPPMNSTTPARSLSSLSLSATSLSHSRPSTPAAIPPLPTTLPSLPSLPAYSQLFHENGDRKDEWLTALPLYREKEDTMHLRLHSSSASSSSVASSVSPEHDPDSDSSVSPVSPVSPTSPVSPVSPGMPLTPPGLGELRRQGRDRKLAFGESFLRFDEDDGEEFDPAEDVAACDANDEWEEVDLGAGEVQYGIAF